MSAKQNIPPAPSISFRLVGCVAALVFVAIVIALTFAAFYMRRTAIPASRHAVEYVLDVSPRMNEPAPGGTRFSVAQAALAEMIRPTDPAVRAGLRLFGNGAQPQPCDDTNLLVPIAPANQLAITNRLFDLQTGPAEQSALATALVAAIRDLAAAEGPHLLVVITGGADTCNPQADLLIAQEAQNAGIDLKLFVIGYDVPVADVSAIKGVAESSGGLYLGVSDSATLQNVVTAVEGYINDPTDTPLSAVAAASTPTAVAPKPDLSTYAAQTACDHPYYPLRPGAVWRFVSPGNFVYQQTVSAVSGDLANAQATVVVQTPYATVTQQWVCNADGIALAQADYTPTSVSLAPFTVVQSFQLGGVKLPPAAQLTTGAHWQASRRYLWSSGQQVDWQSESIVQSEGSLSAGAGTFYTLRIKESNFAVVPSGAVPETSSTVWYGYGVGPVSVTSILTDGRVSASELQSYSNP